MTKEQKSQIVVEIKRQSALSSQNKLATKTGVSSATLSQMVNLNWALIKDEMWRRVKVKLRVELDWVTAPTKSLEYISIHLEKAQELSKSFGISYDAGAGKSHAFKQYSKSNKNVIYIECMTYWKSKTYAKALCTACGLDNHGPRASRPMLSVNCAAIPRDLMESQLFGHKKGAFTSADSDHIGLFQRADLGTLFLDEIGEITLEGQAKLLRILEGHPFLPVGSAQEITSDVRVICATNRDLRDFVGENKFREDLYYRLSVFELIIPPLRQRGPDIRKLIDYFLNHFRHQHGRASLKISDEALQRLLTFQWPGNIRQLRNVIDSAVVMAEGTEILPEDLGIVDSTDHPLETLKVDFWERKLIGQALERCSGNVPEAAKLLGLSRATLYRKIEDYGIQR